MAGERKEVVRATTAWLMYFAACAIAAIGWRSLAALMLVGAIQSALSVRLAPTGEGQ